MRDPIAILVPQMNPNDDHAVVVTWHVRSGGWIDADSSVATMETTKTAFEVEAPSAGFVTYSAEPKSVVNVGSVVAWIHEELPSLEVGASAPSASGPSNPPPAASGSTAPLVAGESAPRFTRKALRRMQELGLKPEDFPGEGRVEVAEVERRGLALAGQPGAANADLSSAPAVALRTESAPSPIDATPLEQSASKIIEAAMLADTYHNVVPSMVTMSCDAALIEKRLQEIGAHNTVSLLELVVHEAARELEGFPELNGWFTDGRAFTYRTVNVGFAINAGRSLKVPVVRDADKRSLREIAQSVRDLTLRYMRNELSLEDLLGGTFTITDLSLYGVVHFEPVLGPRQSAILGLCAQRPALRERDLVLVFDHRMSDGMRAAAFLQGLRKRLENQG